MPTITYSREARCSDCEHLRYYYKGKLKRHKCIKINQPRSLKDGARSCIKEDLFEMRKEYYPKKL